MTQESKPDVRANTKLAGVKPTEVDVDDVHDSEVTDSYLEQEPEDVAQRPMTHESNPEARGVSKLAGVKPTEVEVADVHDSEVTDSFALEQDDDLDGLSEVGEAERRVTTFSVAQKLKKHTEVIYEQSQEAVPAIAQNVNTSFVYV